MPNLNAAPTVMEQLLQNAVDYGLAMAENATPEQIENVRRQNELFDRGLQICPNCSEEFCRDIEFCEFCRQDKIPF